VREVLQERYLKLLQRQYESSAVMSDVKVSQLRTYSTYEHFCAALVQGFWRTCRRNNLRAINRVRGYSHMTMYHVAAYEIQSTWRIIMMQWTVNRVTEDEEKRKNG